MELFALAFAGGIVGAVLMDITEIYAAKRGITSGVTLGLVGRWFIGILHGRFAHANILHTPPFRDEVKAGWIFHLLIGGGGVALLYPLSFNLFGWPLPDRHLLPALLFGLVTSLLPWIILLPAFGWGVFGLRGPKGTNALLASTLAHLPYGLGIALVLDLKGYL